MKKTLAALALLFLMPGLAWGEAPLTLVYTGNSFGHRDPCPSCGNSAIGGLARRSTVFKEMRADPGNASRTVFLAGGSELYSDDLLRAEKGNLKTLVAGYEHLGYDLGAYTPEEAQWLASGAAAPPSGWVAYGEKPQTRVLEKGGVTIGVVLFPAAPADGREISTRTMRSIRTAAHELRDTVDLLVGLCPWGVEGEEAFLSDGTAAFDIVFGSGPGRGVQTKLYFSDATLLVHPYPKGEVVNVVTVRSLPERKSGWRWRLGDNVASDITVLRKNIASDMDMYGILNP
ncbi:hypothetical protein ASZ90_002049 [hydrocarbon metagenome]|uniref:Uncharacterized protein n=1 Tax=hydrocarbon metagenome TaxID=938273 RepID=A0A0W8G4U8_9ZZZZ